MPFFSFFANGRIPSPMTTSIVDKTTSKAEIMISLQGKVCNVFLVYLSMVQELKPRTGSTMAPRRYLWTNIGYGVMMEYLNMRGTVLSSGS